MCINSLALNEYGPPDLSFGNGKIAGKHFIPSNGWDAVWNPKLIKGGQMKKNVKEGVHTEACRKLFGEKADRITHMFDDLSFFSHIWSGMKVRNDHSDEDRALQKFLVEQGGSYDPVGFLKADKACTTAYQEYGLLDKGASFGDQPDVYCTIQYEAGLHNLKIDFNATKGNATYLKTPFEGEVLATLAFKLFDPPVCKKYKARFTKKTFEVMRFSMNKKLFSDRGRVLYRLEYLPRLIIDQRADKSDWADALAYGDYYYKLVNIKHEVGRLLFRGLQKFYLGMIDFYGYGRMPEIRIDTHEAVTIFFNRCLERNIFRLIEDAVFLRDKVDKQSLIAYDHYGFRMSELLLKEIIPEKLNRSLAS